MAKLIFLLEDDTPEYHYLHVNNYLPPMVINESDPSGSISELVPVEITENYNMPYSIFEVPEGYIIVVYE